MLLCYLAVIFLLSLSTIQGGYYDHVNWVEVRNVTIKKGNCTYNNHTFRSMLTVNESCQEMRCRRRKKQVLLGECKPPPTGCWRNSTAGSFPECCGVTCPEFIYRCLTPNGTLLTDGESLNSTSPCEGYYCNKGTLVTQKCTEQKDKKCHVSFRGQGEFPTCCGVRACE